MEALNYGNGLTNDSSLQQIIDLKEFQHEKSDCQRKVLGINWSTDNDEFIFQFDEVLTLAETLPPTKRNILKIGAKIFDPLGLISPINLQFKLIFKRLCLDKYDWDTEITDDVLKTWNSLVNELKSLHKIYVSRRAKSSRTVCLWP